MMEYWISEEFTAVSVKFMLKSCLHNSHYIFFRTFAAENLKIVSDMAKVVLSDAQACAVRYHLLKRYDELAKLQKSGVMPTADFSRLRDVLHAKFSCSVLRLNAPFEDGK